MASTATSRPATAQPGPATTGTGVLDRRVGPLTLRGWMVDTGLAVVLVVVSAAEHATIRATPVPQADTFPEPTWWSYLLVMATPAFLAVRRAQPSVTVVATAALLTAQFSLIELRGNAAALTVLLAAYSAGAFERRPLGYVTIGIGLSLLVGGAAIDGAPLGTLTTITLLSLGPALIGDIVRRRRAATVTLQERADLLELDQQHRAREAVSAERARLAREVHDSVGHAVTAMTMQAGAARAALRGQHPQIGESLATIERVGRDAMAELERLLGILREEGAAAELTPAAPGLAALPRLFDDVRAMGVDVRADVDRPEESLPLAVDLTVFRVVQESLTNVARHAGPVTADVRVEVRPSEVEVSVSHPPAPAPVVAPPSGGRGLLGLG